MKLRTKIIALSTIPLVLTAGVFVGVVSVQRVELRERLTAHFAEQANSECAKIARDVYLMARAHNETLQQKLEADLNVASDVLQRAGAVTFTDETTTWQAINQYTKQAMSAQLPKMLVGDRWLGQNTDPGVTSPVVDRVKSLVGGTCTIFQRMNPNGDMLRVCTNVAKTDGTRAIGTYIPAVNPDGKPNPVISEVLQGRTYRGRAYVVNGWYQTAYAPLLSDDREVVGVLYVGVKEENIRELREGIMDIVVGKSGYVYVLGGTGAQQGQYIISKDGARDGENIWEARDAGGDLFIQSVVEKALSTRDGQCEFERYPWQNEGESAPRLKVAAVTYFEPWDWVIGAGTYEDDYQQARDDVAAALARLGMWTGVIGVGAALLAGVLAFAAALRVVKPLLAVTDGLQDIARGEGDLRKRLDDSSKDEIGELAKWFNAFVGKIEAIISEIMGGVHQIDAGSNQVSSTSQALSEASSEQAASLQQISSSLEEMSSMTTQNAENAQQASGLSTESQQSADRGQREMEQMSEAMDAIKASSAEVAKIIKVIDDIAFQTNLLALNAAVEAARAGEAGKGFAVVAEEVRNLAQRSAEAAKNTAEMIEEATKRADNGAAIASRVGEALEEIVASTSKVNTLVAEIASASKEQADGIGQVNQGVNQLDGVTQQNAGNSEELASASEETAAQASAMRELVAQFKISDHLRSATTRGVRTALGERSGTAREERGSDEPAKKPQEVIPLDEDLAQF